MTARPLPGTEAWRQQQLLRVLWQQAPAEALGGWLREGPSAARRGWQAYQDHAAAVSQRALAGTFPQLAAQIGPRHLAGLAHQAWQNAAPERGDLGQWGQAVPALVADAPPLADLPWLADLAQLEWVLHAAEAAADPHEGPPMNLAALGEPDAAERRLRLQPGSTLLHTAWAVGTLWQALATAGADGHPPAAPAPTPEAVLVLRQGWRATVQLLAPADAGFTAAVLAGHTLAEALDAALALDPAWSFEAWLLNALQQGWLAAVD